MTFEITFKVNSKEKVRLISFDKREKRGKKSDQEIRTISRQDGKHAVLVSMVTFFIVSWKKKKECYLDFM